MDPLEELELMALNSSFATDDTKPNGLEPSAEEVARWQKLFGYSKEQAIQAIDEHRADITRTRISDNHWQMMQSQMEGYDREAYEHYLMMSKAQRKTPAASTSKGSDRKNDALYLFKLGDAQIGEPLSTPTQVQTAAGLATTPPTHKGVGQADEQHANEGGFGAVFCQLDAFAKQRVEQYLANQHPRFQPVFIRYSIARKIFSDLSAHPKLGLIHDTTLPQYRSKDADEVFLPREKQHPVWYFFYGTLADPDILSRVLKLDHPPALQAATVSRGVIKSWGGKYKALVDGPEIAKVEGSAYCVQTEENEIMLRQYETAEYGVVRCTMQLQDGAVENGCTFRFINTGVLS